MYDPDRGARSLEDAIADPVRGQDTTLHDPLCSKTERLKGCCRRTSGLIIAARHLYGTNSKRKASGAGAVFERAPSSIGIDVVSPAL